MPLLPTEPALRLRLLIAASVGAGAVLMAAVVLGAVVWYRSRPKPPPAPVPWNAAAIIGHEPPGFDVVTGMEKRLIRLSFIVENTTARDYEFKRSSVKLMLKYKDGSLEGPIDVLGGMLLRDAFVPANQRGQINLLMGAPEAPEKAAGRNEKDYHEQLRAYLNEHFSGLSGFVLYDDLNHFQINLPRWRSEPKKPE